MKEKTGDPLHTSPLCLRWVFFISNWWGQIKMGYLAFVFCSANPAALSHVTYAYYFVLLMYCLISYKGAFYPADSLMTVPL